MYKNIGKTIMGWAGALGWVGLAFGILAALVFAVKDNGSAALISLGSGVGCFALSLILYAFGRLVDDTQVLREHFAPEQTDAVQTAGPEVQKDSSSESKPTESEEDKRPNDEWPAGGRRIYASKQYHHGGFTCF